MTCLAELEKEKRKAKRESLERKLLSDLRALPREAEGRAAGVTCLNTAS